MSSQDFTITKVSSNPPRAWSFKGRDGNQVPMESYKVMVEGQDEPVEVNRKPGNFPVVGEVITGSIETTEYGLRFKAEKKPFTPGGKNQEEIKAEWAIGQAVAWCPDDASLGVIETTAKELFLMVERVKQATPEKTSGYDKAKAVVEAIKNKEPVPYSFEGEPVSLDDIPF